MATNSNKIPAKLYKTKVYEGVMDFAHGGGKWLEMVYIPSEQIVFNVDNGKTNVFSLPKIHDKIRDVCTIQIDAQFVEKLKMYIEMKESISATCAEYLK